MFIHRDDLSKKMKKKRQRLPLTVGGAAASSFSLQTSKSVSDWLNISNKVIYILCNYIKFEFFVVFNASSFDFYRI